MKTDNMTTQMGLSCYIGHYFDDDDHYIESEGNCWFVSAYNILQSMADATGDYKKAIDKLKTNSTKDSMPKCSKIENYNPKVYEPNIYSNYYNDSDENITGWSISSSGEKIHRYEVKNFQELQFPSLYNNVRKYVTNTYDKIEGGTVYNPAEIINSIGEQYGYSFKAHGTVCAGLYGSSGITAIKKNLPFALCTAAVSNGGYGNHIMAGCGYKVYTKTSGWWIFKTVSYKYFYELRDGHNEGKIYFDLSNWTGFGGIVLLNYSIFAY